MTAEDAANLICYQKVVRSGARDSDGNLPPLIAVSVTGDRTHALTAEGHDASEDGTGRGTPIVAVPAITPTRQGARPHAVAFHLTQDPVSGPVVPALGGKSGGNGVATETVVRRLTPLECERLQGAPDGWTEGQADSPRYRQLGNAVAVPVFEWVGRRLSEVDAALTSEAVA